MKFTPIDFTAESALRYSFSRYEPGGRWAPYSRILAIHIHGVFGHGSAGAQDGRFIYALCQAADTLWTPDAILLDLRELRYEWGNEFEWFVPLSLDGRKLPYALAVSGLCLPAISTLVYGMDTKRSATEEDYIFDEFDAAAIWLGQQLTLKREAAERKREEYKRKFGKA